MSELIFGAGHLGRHLAAALPDAKLYPGRMEDVRAGDLDDVDVVVCAAGKTDLAWCEANPLEAWQANVAAPLALAAVARQAGTRYVHLSSGCVYDGPFHPSGRPFLPDDPPSPACFYAWTKAACDALLMQTLGATRAILRPRQVYSPTDHPRNTLTKLRNYPRLLDTPNSMTSADTVAATVRSLVQNARSPLWGRVSLVYDQGVVSPHAVGCLLADAGLRARPEVLDKADLDAWHRPKRVDTVLHDAVFLETIKPPAVEDALRRVIVALTRRQRPT